MTPTELDRLLQLLEGEFVRRTALGDYDANARGIRVCIEALFKIAAHLKDMQNTARDKRKHADRD